MFTTDLFHPLDQFALACLLEGGHSDGKLLAPRVSFFDLDVRREFWIDGVLAILAFWLWFPTGILFPPVPVLREECLWARVSALAERGIAKGGNVTSISTNESASTALKN